MICDCGSTKTERNGKCASCNRLERKAASIQPSDNNSPINKHSEKGAKMEAKYLARLKTWKRGKKCEGYFAHECLCPIPDKGILTVHHMAGRGEGFYDEYAEERGIPLTLDERLWKPLCINAHKYIEEHPKFAWENQYSFKRLTDPIFIKP